MAALKRRRMMVDWSARSRPAPARPSPDAIWIAVDDEPARYFRTRQEAEAWIAEQFIRESWLAGFDFGFTMAAWVHRALDVDWLGYWNLLEQWIVDREDANNRWAVAEELNRRLSGGPFPFWATPRPSGLLPARRSQGYSPGREEFREPERWVAAHCPARPQSSFKLYTAGSVGSQILLGLPVLARLRRRYAAELAVWPFESLDRRIVLAETYPSMWPVPAAPVKDKAQVETVARLMRHAAELLCLPAEARRWREEGWILGANEHYPELSGAIG